ncbi:hypothetical protein KP806_18250 [Paenibacillus sp. N4]|uniref:hypothetical protein n=1 Tax=Paenibacillus vietnamensis TaxID=2590547 RepID=UPI001CD0FDCA|nr:hypothetical protein [Paenibacillus vietnamensis]MCA0757006.1 hypothetical protein [Paenibacillus vietnamensis]
MRKYNQKVTAVMHRVYCDSLGYVFVRKKTKITFGPGEQTHGLVIMSNPGSFSPESSNHVWMDFCNGTGSDELEVEGHPDVTMQNIIQALQSSASASGSMLNGSIDIYNLSAVVQPKGDDAEKYHHQAELALSCIQQQEILNEHWMNGQSEFNSFLQARNDQFVIMGFVKKLFLKKQRNIQNWSRSLPNVLYAEDKSGYWSHPRRWRTELWLREQIEMKLNNYFLNF